MSRSNFINASASQKIILTKLYATKRFINFTDEGGNVYSKVVDKFVTAVKTSDNVALTEGSSAALNSGEFFYDSITSTVYVRLSDDSDPNLSKLIFTVALFFANQPMSLPHDLQPGSRDVYWDGRISSAPNFKTSIGIGQDLVSTVGSGTLELHNLDGGLDNDYDDLVFENQVMEVYSLNKRDVLGTVKLIFIGIVHDKTFDSETVQIKVKDDFFNLLEDVPQGVFDENDNVNDNVLGKYKRWVYGRVDGMQLQSIDQIGEGYDVTGTVSVTVDSNVLTGDSTSFLSECSPGDTVIIGNLEFSIDTVDSDTQLTLDDEADYSIEGSTMTLVPEIPPITKNREFFVAGHACAEITTTVTKAIQFNRIQLSDTTGILEGDILEFVEQGERIEVKNVAPGNIVVLRQTLLIRPDVGSTVIRQPIQDLFIEGIRVQNADYTITNVTGQTTVTIADDAEFNIAPVQNLNQDLTFTNGSRIITGGVELTEKLESRDYIRPEDVTYSTFYEILEVQDEQIILREPFNEATITDTAEIKTPTFIGDDTIVSVNLLGKTKDGTPSGEWIRTSADVSRDLISEIGLTSRINESSFTETSGKAPALVSLMLPLEPTGGATTVKDAIDLVAVSTRCALSLDDDLNLAYKSTLIRSPQNATIVDDSDVVRWSITSKSGQLYKYSTIRYRHGDINRFTLEAGNKVSTHTSNFVSNYVGTSKTVEKDVYLYNEFDANIFAERILYYNSLSLAEITIETDLRLENLDIGDIVQLEFRRLYRRKGDNTRKKLAAVTGKVITGDRMTLTLTDYGNTFNTSSFITADDAPDYDNASDNEKIINGYITDAQGIVNHVEETAEINKIS